MSDDNFLEHKEEWEKLISQDPMWAVLSNDDKKGNNWEAEEFYRTGVKSIGRVMRHVKDHIPKERAKAIDFGCGLGRLTFPLAGFFDEVIGVDVTRVAIIKAKERLKDERITFLTNEKSDLSLIEDDAADFVLSLITLQHIRPQYAEKYIEEFLRVLKPGGIAYFQLPSHLVIRNLGTLLYSLTPNRLFKKVSKYIHSNSDEGFMEMNNINRKKVLQIISKFGGQVVEVREDKSAGKEWKSFTYIIRKA